MTTAYEDTERQLGLYASNSDALERAVEVFAPLTSEESLALRELSRGTSRSFGPRRDIVQEGERPKGVYLIETGWACRYKVLPDGRRQVLSVLLPGDLFDLNLDLVASMDHSIAAVSRLQLVELAPERLRAAMTMHPKLIEAFYWRQLVESATAREWVCSIGQRTALERVAHFICELYVRLNIIGRAPDYTFPFLMTQADVADATGLTPVHINRMIKELRERGLIEVQSKKVRISNLSQLRDVGLFNGSYLHLGRRRQH